MFRNREREIKLFTGIICTLYKLWPCECLG